MQISIYHTGKDKYLIDKLGKKARVERKSKSAVALSILEEYFEKGEKVRQILCDIGSLTSEQLTRSLEIQGRGKNTDFWGKSFWMRILSMRRT